MKIEAILAAKAEAKRFNNAVNTLIMAYGEQRKSGIHYPHAPKQSGAVRRASMDLSRSLSVMRSSK